MYFITDRDWLGNFGVVNLETGENLKWNDNEEDVGSYIRNGEVLNLGITSVGVEILCGCRNGLTPKSFGNSYIAYRIKHRGKTVGYRAVIFNGRCYEVCNLTCKQAMKMNDKKKFCNVTEDSGTLRSRHGALPVISVDELSKSLSSSESKEPVGSKEPVESLEQGFERIDKEQDKLRRERYNASKEREKLKKLEKVADEYERAGKSKAVTSYIKDKLGRLNNKNTARKVTVALVTGVALMSGVSALGSSEVALNRSEPINVVTNRVVDNPEDSVSSAIRLKQARYVEVKDNKIYVDGACVGSVEIEDWKKSSLVGNDNKEITSLVYNDTYNKYKLTSLIGNDIELERKVPSIGSPNYFNSEYKIEDGRIYQGKQVVYKAKYSKSGVVSIERVKDSNLSYIEAVLLLNSIHSDAENIEILNLKAE